MSDRQRLAHLELLTGIAARIKDLISDVPLPVLVYHTEDDERVCPICDPLDKTAWDLNDSRRPKVPEDTHPNCRCYYTLEWR